VLFSDVEGEGEGPEDMPADDVVVEDQGDDEGDEALAFCGDGRPDPGEECDDGNDAPGDGCEPSCTFSCHENSDCDDGNVCTLEQCVEGGFGRICSFEFTTSTCDDGDPCTEQDRCDGRGSCTGEEIVCPDDGNVCTVNHSCYHVTGLCTWSPAPDTTSCDDGNPATPMDRCSGIDDRCVAVIPTWVKTYGRTASEYIGTSFEYGRSIRQISDHGFIVAGDAEWNGIADEWNYVLFKTDEQGILQWQKEPDEMTSEKLNFILQTADGGYLAVGSDFYGAAARVTKLDENVETLWERYYSGIEFLTAIYVRPTLDGHYLVAGLKRFPSVPIWDSWIFKMDDAGNVIWHRFYGTESGSELLYPQPTSDGGFIGTGLVSSSDPDRKLWIVRLDGGGDMLWQIACEGDKGIQPLEASGGGFMIAGETTRLGAGRRDVLLAGLDESGNLLWYRTYGGPSDDFVRAMQHAVDGGYVFAGSTQSFGAGEEDVWVVRIDDLGNILWQKTYGGLDSDYAADIQETMDGGYVVVGTTFSFSTDESDVWVLKMDSMGQISGTCPTGLGVDSAAVVMEHAAICEHAEVGQRLLDVIVDNFERPMYDAVMSDATQCSR